MRELHALALSIALGLGAGCGASYAYPPTPEPSIIEAGPIRLETPLPLHVTRDETSTFDGVPTHVVRQEARTAVYGLVVVTLERRAPFTGPRDEILEAAMGDEARGGSIGPVTFDYSSGVFTAGAIALLGERGEGSVDMRAFMTRNRLVVVAVGGRTIPVERTIASIVVAAREDELFFRPPTEPVSDAVQSVWGLGFSCLMPGGVTVERSERGAMRYVARSGDHTLEVTILPDQGEPLDAQVTRASQLGRVLEDTDDFAAGVRFRRLVIQGSDGWHSLFVTEHRTFQFTGIGTPTPPALETANAFFDSCVY